MAKKYERDFRLFKDRAILTAEELGYGEDVIEDILFAKSEEEINRILDRARNGEN